MQSCSLIPCKKGEFDQPDTFLLTSYYSKIKYKNGLKTNNCLRDDGQKYSQYLRLQSARDVLPTVSVKRLSGHGIQNVCVVPSMLL